jgi:hypothetical protein
LAINGAETISTKDSRKESSTTRPSSSKASVSESVNKHLQSTKINSKKSQPISFKPSGKTSVLPVATEDEHIIGYQAEYKGSRERSKTVSLKPSCKSSVLSVRTEDEHIGYQAEYNAEKTSKYYLERLK